MFSTFMILKRNDSKVATDGGNKIHFTINFRAILRRHV